MKIKIPKYSLAEELINAISHGLGAALAIAALVICVVFSAISNKQYSIIASIIYTITLFIMFLISTLYHSFPAKFKVKQIFRVLDHCSIYLFIAGSYTPYCMLALNDSNGIILCILVWFCAIIGIILNLISLEKFKIVSQILYILMGWAIIFNIKNLMLNVAPFGIFLLAFGGILYTIGAILYGIGKKKKYFHSIFHIFILAASICHFFSILLYVILN